MTRAGAGRRRVYNTCPVPLFLFLLSHLTVLKSDSRQSPAFPKATMDGQQNGASPVEGSRVLYRDLHDTYKNLARGEGSYLIFEDGQRILDASGGAAVACIGHGDKRVLDAVVKQMTDVAYCATTFYTTRVCERLCDFLIDSTGGKMSRAVIFSSGTEKGDECA